MLSLTDLQTVAGVAVVLTILTQLAKSYVPERLIPATAVVAGIALSVLATLALGSGSAEAIGNAALTGLLGGASAIGIYQVQKPLSILPPKV